MISKLNNKMIDAVAGGRCFCICFGPTQDMGVQNNEGVCETTCLKAGSKDSMCTDTPNAPVKKNTNATSTTSSSHFVPFCIDFYSNK